MDEITISARRYKALVDDVRFLDALRAAGVDNWEGYDEAIDIYNQNDDSAD